MVRYWIFHQPEGLSGYLFEAQTLNCIRIKFNSNSTVGRHLIIEALVKALFGYTVPKELHLHSHATCKTATHAAVYLPVAGVAVMP